MTGSTSLLTTVLSVYCLSLPLVSLLASKGVVPLLLITAVLAGVLAWRSGRRPSLPDRAVLAAISALLAWCAIASFWGLDPGRAFRLTGRIAALFAAGVLLFAVARVLNDDVRARLGRWLVVGVALSLAVVAAEIAFDYPLFRVATPDAADLGDIRIALNRGATAMVILAWPAMAYLWTSGAHRAALALPVATGLLLPFLTSTAAIVGLIAGAAAAAAAQAHRKAGQALLVIMTVAALAGSPIAAKWFYMLDWQGADWLPESAQQRVEIWNFAVDRFVEKPVLGWGFDSSRAMSSLNPPLEKSGRAPVSLHPHSAPLQILLELGLVGGLIALALALTLIARLEALPRPTRAFAQATYAATLLIACTAYGVWQNRWLALMISAAVIVRLTAPPVRQRDAAGEAAGLGTETRA